MSELKPCPFCGNETALRCLDENQIECYGEGEEILNPYYAVVCSMNEDSPIPTSNWKMGCGGSGGFRRTQEEAIETWNRRAEK